MAGNYLQVEGAKIYFEVEGAGPYTVCVPGSSGDFKVFLKLRSCLVKYFTVVLYDRRGYGGSQLNGNRDYVKHIDDDVEDLYDLMKNLTNEKFVIFSSSLGGLVATKYLIKYPETVSKTFSHEPMFDLLSLPNHEEIQRKHEEIYKINKYNRQDTAMISLGKYHCNKSDFEVSNRSTTDELYLNRNFILTKNI